MFFFRDRKFPLFKYDCIDRIEREDTKPFVDISVYITNSCNAKCKFCCNGNKVDFQFDIDKFQDFFQDISSKIEINKLTFTGGEPTLRENILNRCLDIVNGKCKLITVNTNGFNLESLCHRAIDRIALSRHHYDTEINNRIFGTNINNPLTNFKYKNKVIITCNLIKGEIDSIDKIYDFLEFVSNSEVNEACFIGLMPLNKFSIDNVISPENINFNNLSLCYRELCYKNNICACKNYTYISKSGKLISFYTKHNKCPNYNKGSFITWENNRIK